MTLKATTRRSENGKDESPAAAPQILSLPPTIELETGEGQPGQALLDSPQAFGIHINGTLVRFRKGRTPLTPEQAEACERDSYVKDNGAEVIYRPKTTKIQRGV